MLCLVYQYVCIVGDVFVLGCFVLCNMIVMGGGAFPQGLASLEPQVSEKGKKHILHKAYALTGKLINKLRDVWGF